MSTIEERSRERTRINEFIAALRKLEAREDRATLARLRTGLRTRDGIALPMMSFVSPHLDEHERPSDRWYYAVAALFAMHPTPGGTGSLGMALARLRSQSGSVEKRFHVLLECDSEGLFPHLTHTVRILKTHEIPVPWFSLLGDLTPNIWDAPERRIQRKWARHFYYSAKAVENTQPAGDDDND